MTKAQEKKCHAIIHTAATGAGAVGASLAQLPGSDNAMIVPMQAGMILSLGAVFGIQLTETVAKTFLATTTATMVGRGISQVLVGWIPGIGNIFNAVTAAGVTETIGWTIAKNFDKSVGVNP